MEITPLFFNRFIYISAQLVYTFHLFIYVLVCSFYVLLGNSLPWVNLLDLDIEYRNFALEARNYQGALSFCSSYSLLQVRYVGYCT